MPVLTTATPPYLSGVVQYTTCAHCGGYYQIGTSHYCTASLAAPTRTGDAFATKADMENIHTRIDSLETSINGLTSVLAELLTAMKGIKR